MSVPVRDGSREGSPPAPAGCPVCGAPVPSGRARYCSRACQQRAYRLRQHPRAAADTAHVRADLRRRRLLVAHTVYACPRCEASSLGEQRCPDCGVFGRAVGLGGRCPECDAIIVLADLLPPGGPA